MARFNTATIAAVPVSKTVVKREGPSQRSIIQGAYQAQMAEAFAQGEDAILVIELEETDKPLTERNRVLAAAKALGFTVKVKRRVNTMYVFRVPAAEAEAVPEAETAPRKRNKRSK